MTHPTHHITLVAEAPMPTIGPLLDKNIGAHSATLVHTPYTQPFAEHQAKVLTAHGINVQLHLIADPYHLSAIIDSLTPLAHTHHHGTCLNLTGGSKLMALAAWQLFNQPQHHLYYIHLNNDSIVWLNQPLPDHPIADTITLDTYLAATGYQIDNAFASDSLPPTWHQLAEQLATGQYTHELRHLLRHLHHLPDTQQPSSNPIDPIGQQKIRNLIHRMDIMGMVKWHNTNLPEYRKLIFTSAEALRFIRGEWLEQYVYAQCKSLSQTCPKFQDIRISAFLVNPKDPVQASPTNQAPLKNEMDIVALRDNTLYLIECKTANLDDNSKAEAILTKLDSLRDILGGIKGKAMLLTSTKVSSMTKRRAKEINVTLIDRDTLPKLAHHLKRWFNCT